MSVRPLLLSAAIVTFAGVAAPAAAQRPARRPAATATPATRPPDEPGNQPPFANRSTAADSTRQDSAGVPAIQRVSTTHHTTVIDGKSISYTARAGTMVLTTAILGGVMAYATGRMLYTDGKLFDLRNNWKGFTALFGRQGRMTRLLPKFLDFFRPDFHPNDHDTTALVVEWREKLFGADGELNHLLKGKTLH